jgi:hypothetical protein
LARRRQVTERIPQTNHRKVSQNHHIIAANVLAIALILVALSLSHLASGVSIVTGLSPQAAWSMAVGIDLGFIACELAVLVSPDKIGRDVSMYASPAIIATLAISAAMNSFAFALCAEGWMVYPAIELGIAVPALIYALIKVAGTLALAAERG